MNDTARAAIKRAAHEEERATDIQLTHVHMRVIAGFRGLAEPRALLGLLTFKSVHHAGLPQDTEDA